MTASKSKRPHGTGALYVRTDAVGRESWYGRWYANGREVKRCIGRVRPPKGETGLTKTAAEKRLIELMAEAVAKREKGDRLTIADLGRLYLDDLEKMGRKKATLTAVESALRIWLAPFFGERDVKTIGKRDVEDLIRNMRNGTRTGARQKGDRRYGKPVTSKSIRNYIGTLSALLNFAVREELLAVNIASRVRLPRATLTDDYHFLTPDELRSLVAAVVRGEYEALDRALYLTAAMTGLREGELCALRWRDVDWKAAKIRVRRNYVLGEITTPKSRRSQRAVPMPDEVAGELDRLFKASSRQAEDDLVFADPTADGRSTGRF
jgi:integrase